MRRKPVPKKTILGHSHTPEMIKGAYQVGTVKSMGCMGYNKGPAKWLGNQTITYANGDKLTVPLYAAGVEEYPAPRRREAIEHTRRKLGL